MSEGYESIPNGYNEPMQLKSFNVGVFDDTKHPNRKPLAYTMWYNKDWDGCCVHVIEAENGNQAKNIAIRDHIKTCRPKRSEERKQ